MTLQALGGGDYDYVQSSQPSSPDIGETWLDTSTDPPISKVYADLGGGGQWTTDLLDAQISSRSSHDDPDPNGYIDGYISNAGTPGPKGTVNITTGSVSGSGWIIGAFLSFIGNPSGYGYGDNMEMSLTVDGTSVGKILEIQSYADNGSSGGGSAAAFTIPFDSSFDVSIIKEDAYRSDSGVLYVLD